MIYNIEYVTQFRGVITDNRRQKIAKSPDRLIQRLRDGTRIENSMIYHQNESPQIVFFFVFYVQLSI